MMFPINPYTFSQNFLTDWPFFKKMKKNVKIEFLSLANLSCSKITCQQKSLKKVCLNPQTKSSLLCRNCYQKVLRAKYHEQLKSEVNCDHCNQRIVNMFYWDFTDKTKRICSSCNGVLFNQRLTQKEPLSLKKRKGKRKVSLSKAKQGAPLKIQKVAQEKTLSVKPLSSLLVEGSYIDFMSQRKIEALRFEQKGPSQLEKGNEENPFDKAEASQNEQFQLEDGIIQPFQEEGIDDEIALPDDFNDPVIDPVLTSALVMDSFSLSKTLLPPLEEDEIYALLSDGL